MNAFRALASSREEFRVAICGHSRCRYHDRARIAKRTSRIGGACAPRSFVPREGEGFTETEHLLRGLLDDKSNAIDR